MKVNSKDFCVPEGADVKLRKWPTNIKPLYASKQQYQELLQQHVEQLSEQQQLLYSSNTQAILLIFQALDAAGRRGSGLKRINTQAIVMIFQALDAAGKDGVIKHVMSGVNPQGCQVFSF